MPFPLVMELMATSLKFTGDGIWQFNLKIKDLTALGSYTITMVSGDDSEYEIDPTCEVVFERE